MKRADVVGHWLSFRTPTSLRTKIHAFIGHCTYRSFIARYSLLQSTPSLEKAFIDNSLVKATYSQSQIRWVVMLMNDCCTCNKLLCHTDLMLDHLSNNLHRWILREKVEQVGSPWWEFILQSSGIKALCHDTQLLNIPPATKGTNLFRIKSEML